MIDDPIFKKIVEEITQYDGTIYIYGGYVRDIILGISSNYDIDLQVYGLHTYDLQNILIKYGKITTLGLFFDSFLEPTSSVKLETKSGKEYDFSLSHNTKIEEKLHFLNLSSTPKEMSYTTDFTINALLQNPLTDEIIDFHNGLDDLKNKKLKATSKEFFSIGPERVLRGMQFSGRLNFDIDLETIEISKKMLPLHNRIPSDFISQNWMKFAEKSIMPSKGLQFLIDSNWIYVYPELELSKEKMEMMSKAFDSPIDFFATLVNGLTKKDSISFLRRIYLPEEMQFEIIRNYESN